MSVLTHLFVSTKANGTDTSKLRPTDWNADHVFGGGALGSILYRDTGLAGGASWLADVAAGSVLVSGGVGAAPAWSASPTLTALTISSGVSLTSTDVQFSNTGHVQIGTRDPVPFDEWISIGAGPAEAPWTTYDRSIASLDYIALAAQPIIRVTGDVDAVGSGYFLASAVSDGSPHTVGELYGIRINAGSFDPNLTVTNTYGLYVTQTNASTVAGAWGIWDQGKMHVTGNTSIAGKLIIGSHATDINYFSGPAFLVDANAADVAETSVAKFSGNLQSGGYAGDLLMSSYRNDSTGAAYFSLQAHDAHDTPSPLRLQPDGGGLLFGGYFEGTEMTAPTAPAADKGRIYFDVSGVKTRLMVLFQSGAAQQIAIEP